MTESNNWELYSSEEEVDKKEFQKRNTTNNKPGPSDALYKNKEDEYLERYMNLAGNALDVFLM